LALAGGWEWYGKLNGEKCCCEAFEGFAEESLLDFEYTWDGLLGMRRVWMSRLEGFLFFLFWRVSRKGAIECQSFKKEQHAIDFNLRVSRNFFKAYWKFQSFYNFSKLSKLLESFKSSWNLQILFETFKASWNFKSFMELSKLYGTFKASWNFQSFMEFSKLHGTFKASWNFQSFMELSKLHGTFKASENFQSFMELSKILGTSKPLWASMTFLNVLLSLF
jgi:hypothetical protein